MISWIFTRFPMNFTFSWTCKDLFMYYLGINEFLFSLTMIESQKAYLFPVYIHSRRVEQYCTFYFSLSVLLNHTVSVWFWNQSPPRPGYVWLHKYMYWYTQYKSSYEARCEERALSVRTFWLQVNSLPTCNRARQC